MFADRENPKECLPAVSRKLTRSDGLANSPPNSGFPSQAYSEISLTALAFSEVLPGTRWALPPQTDQSCRPQFAEPRNGARLPQCRFSAHLYQIDSQQKKTVSFSV